MPNCLPWRFADRRLVDFEHAVDGLKAREARAADQRGQTWSPLAPHCVSSLPPKGGLHALGRPGGAQALIHGIAPGFGRALLHPGLDVGQQHVARQGGFA